MSKYLLACPQGHEITIDTSQAGCPVRCDCGAEVIAPTLRGLSQLPRAAETSEELKSASAMAPSNWGLREGMIFTGIIVTVVALIPLMWLLANRPERPIMPEEMKQYNVEEVQAMTISETMQLWDKLRAPMEEEEPMIIVQYNAVVAEHRQYLIMAGIGVAAGLAICGAGWMQSKRKPAA